MQGEKGRWCTESPLQHVSARTVLTTGIKSGTTQPTMLWAHPCDRTHQRQTSSWISWLSNHLADDCEVFFQNRVFYESQVKCTRPCPAIWTFHSPPTILFYLACQSFGSLSPGSQKTLVYLWYGNKNLSWTKRYQIILAEILLFSDFFLVSSISCCLVPGLFIRPCCYPSEYSWIFFCAKKT